MCLETQYTDLPYLVVFFIWIPYEVNPMPAHGLVVTTLFQQIKNHFNRVIRKSKQYNSSAWSLEQLMRTINYQRPAVRFNSLLNL